MQEIERKQSSRHLPSDCQKYEKLFRATLLKAASHHIPTGRRTLYTQQVPAEILAMMEEQDDLRKQDRASTRLSTMNDEITKAIQIQNPFLTAQSTQIKSVISVPIKDFIHHYPRALFNDIPRVGTHFNDIPGSGRTFTTYLGRGAV